MVTTRRVDPRRTDARAATSDEIARRLTVVGQRLTRGRRAVVDAVAASGAPLSVPEIQQLVGDAVPQSSLYRIINDLVEARVLRRLEFAEGFGRFELDEDLDEHHHHLVCTSCGDVRDLGPGDLADDTGIDRLEEAILLAAGRLGNRTGFAVTSHRLDFFGRCERCRDADEQA